MAGATISIKGVLDYFPKPLFPKIDGEATIEVLIYLHQLISGNSAPVVLNLVGGQHRHVSLLMTAEEYMEQAGFAFVPPHNLGG